MKQEEDHRGVWDGVIYLPTLDSLPVRTGGGIAYGWEFLLSSKEHRAFILLFLRQGRRKSTYLALTEIHFQTAGNKTVFIRAYNKLPLFLFQVKFRGLIQMHFECNYFSLECLTYF